MPFGSSITDANLQPCRRRPREGCILVALPAQQSRKHRLVIVVRFLKKRATGVPADGLSF
jgi:hypothetical protein